MKLFIIRGYAKPFIILPILFQFIFFSEIFSQGSGADGALTLGAGTTTINTVKSDLTSTASSGQKVVNVTSAASFAATNLVFIIQMLGTNVGVWEVATISSISVNAITMSANLTNTYTKSGGTSLAQVIKIPQYTNVTVGSGKTLTASAWDGTTGGVLVFYSNGTVTVDGTIDMNGKGYRGGTGASGAFGPNPGAAGGGGGAASCNNGTDGGVIAGTGPAGGASCNVCAGHSGGEGGLRATQTGASGSAGEGPAGGAGGGATGAVGGDNSTSCWTGHCTLIQMGSGGGGGKAGDVSSGGGGGGGGAANGVAASGGTGSSQCGPGGDGGDGGAGGGIIFINANAFAGAGTGVIRVNGGNGSNGGTGAAGGPGGTGGQGAANNPNYGGGGGGGQGANGADGGGAGAFGAGGAIYLAKASSTYSGTQTVAHGSHGAGGTGGAGGSGGGAGASGGGCSSPGTAGTAGSTGATGLAGVDPAGGGNGDVTLPIELISFDAFQKDDIVYLSWITASETNNDYFAIEKSKDGMDWTWVVNIKGAGNTSTSKHYFSVDNNPYNSGIAFYRLKQVDYNGVFSFSNIVSLKFNASDENIFRVYPTLSSGNFNVSISGKKDEQVFIVVKNIFGQEYYSKGFIVENDEFIQCINLSGVLASGIYMVIASSDDRVFAKKIVVK